MDKIIEKLQLIFDAKLLRAHKIDPGHDSTNEIFAVQTEQGKYIVKVIKDSHMHGVFWKGLHLLFGASHEVSIKNQDILSKHINQFGLIPAPKVYKAEKDANNPLKKPYVILEMMPGNPITSESETAEEIMKSPDVALQLGALLGSIHTQTFSSFGNLDKQGSPLSEFPNKLAATIQTLASTKKALNDPLVQKMLPYYISKARSMEPPKVSSLIMLDLWPSQFLEDKGHLRSLVDIESFCIGPIELELCLLELWLKKRSKFKEAYFSVNTYWPDYEETREIYRYFLYLLYDCPSEGLQSCLDSRGKFAQADRIRSRISAPRLRMGPSFNPFNPYDEDD
ncbi:MAG: phosphotransferase [Proteobacteria bacterium]|nr:phosphotransferase [Pseudomonadota bacterium]